MCDAVREWDVLFHVLNGHPGIGPAGSFVQCFGQGVFYGYAEFALPLAMSGAPPVKMVTFNVMEPTREKYWLRGHDLNAGMAWVFPEGAELCSLSPPGFRVHTLSVQESFIEEIASALELKLPRESKRPEIFAMTPARHKFVLKQLRAVRDFHGAPSSGSVWEILTAMLTDWLAPSSPGGSKRPIVRARDRAMKRCMELIVDERLTRISVPALLQASRVSERTMQYAFRERFGVSPSALCKSLNLARARSELRSGSGVADSVTDIATRYGFQHMGQFARDYRKLFGERPSDTLRNCGSRRI